MSVHVDETGAQNAPLALDTLRIWAVDRPRFPYASNTPCRDEHVGNICGSVITRYDEGAKEQDVAVRG